MIDLYTWTTDNGFKARHGAEESGLEYTLKPVNLRKKAQFEPEYLKISPGHKIPALVDDDGPGGQRITLCESGAILKYLGEKAGNGLYPADPVARVKVDQWLFFGSSTFTTLAQQYGFWNKRNPEDVPPAKKHYDEVLRDMLATLNRHLGDNEYVAGNYSVADISMYPDVHLHGVNEIGLAEYPNLKRWHDAIEVRPAVQRAWEPFSD
ncbi:MAG: glutathione S-transferase family protein [Alphaproteobacteria bacterium]|nr:glutathione S-transferase family protein [Alphaproteobacteria bacterium]